MNGTQWKLIMGDCAGWDTNSSNVSPPGYVPDPVHNAGDRGAVGPLGKECNPAGAKGFEPGKPPQTTWLFKTRSDPSERCDLSLAYPDVVIAMQQRLTALQATAVPCRFPNGDPAAQKAWDAAGGQRGPWLSDPHDQPET